MTCVGKIGANIHGIIKPRGEKKIPSQYVCMAAVLNHSPYETFLMKSSRSFLSHPGKAVERQNGLDRLTSAHYPVLGKLRQKDHETLKVSLT